MGVERWLQEVVVPNFGFLDQEWLDWLGEVHAQRGWVAAKELLALVLERQLEVGAAAVARVVADVEKSTGRVTRVVLVHEAYSVRVQCDGEFSNHDSGGLFAVTPESAAVEVAATVQDIVLEQWWQVWPVCPEHDAGLHVDLLDRRAVWVCRLEQHVVAVVGQLHGADTP